MCGDSYRSLCHLQPTGQLVIQFAGALIEDCVYVRRQGHGPEDAQDLTQVFFARFLAKGYLRLSDPGRGRFRTFLLSAMKNFLVNEWRRGQATSRPGKAARALQRILENRFLQPAAPDSNGLSKMPWQGCSPKQNRIRKDESCSWWLLRILFYVFTLWQSQTEPLNPS